MTACAEGSCSKGCACCVWEGDDGWLVGSGSGKLVTDHKAACHQCWIITVAKLTGISRRKVNRSRAVTIYESDSGIRLSTKWARTQIIGNIGEFDAYLRHILRHIERVGSISECVTKIGYCVIGQISRDPDSSNARFEDIP